jgi:hypothetical protein
MEGVWMMDSTTTARRLAAKIGRDLFQAHRGVLSRSDGRLVIFGNDGYQQDQRSRQEVELLRRKLCDSGFTEEDFGTDPTDGYTWVLIVVPPKAHSDDRAAVAFTLLYCAAEAEDMLWDAWLTACASTDSSNHEGFAAVQRGIAEGAIAAFEAMTP